MDDDGRGRRGGLRWPPSTETLFVAALALWGWRLGARAITDNSTFVHLRTGIDVARGLGLPDADPYSFTAAGEPWTVQSWLAVVVYGALHDLGRFELVMLAHAALLAALGALTAVAARAGSALRTAAAATIAVGIGSPFWVPRPLVFGLLAMATLVLAVERGWPRWILLPLGWLWVNTHGSFPLAVAWLVARAVGEAIDERAWPRRTGAYLPWALGGIALGAVNPVGPKLLTFPLTVFDKRDVFRTITEWRPPDPDRVAVQVAAVFAVAALVVLARRCRSWTDAVPVALFALAGLVAMRNIAVAAIVVAPALGRALRAPEPRATEPATEPDEVPAPAPRVNAVFAAVLAVAALLLGASGWRSGGIDAPPDDYPVAAVEWMHEHGLRGPEHRLAHDEVAGCYLILRDGREARVFVDDRFDMYPVEVSEDLDRLYAGREAALDVIDKWRIDVVLWKRAGRLTETLRGAGWREVYADPSWAVLRAPDGAI